MREKLTIIKIFVIFIKEIEQKTNLQFYQNQYLLSHFSREEVSISIIIVNLSQ